jgi:sugar (glycoside-pentoside-hexuronide) transporter
MTKLSKPAAVQQEKLKLGAYLGYGVGDLAVNLFFQSAIIFLLFFYTDVFGISAAAAGTIFLVARLIDAVTDPIMGMIADRTKTRWGKFRPYLLFGAPPLAVIAVAMFTVPDLDEDGKVIYAYVTYILFSIAYTVVSIPYSGLTALITGDAKERTTLSAYRMAFALGGGIIVGVGTQPLVTWFGGGAEGFQMTMGLYGVIAILLLAMTFRSTEERVAAVETAPPSFKDMISVMSRNLPLWLLIIAFLMGMLAYILRSSAVIYYFQYNLGRADLFPIYMLAILLGQLAGIVVTPWLANRWGKKNTYVIGALLGIVTAIALYFTPYDALGAIFVISGVGSFFFAAPTVLGWAMLPDTVEYAEWKQGVRAEGAIYATSSFFQKLAMAVGGALAAAVLSATGYVAGEVQSKEALDGILMMVTLGPVVVMIIGIAAISFYPLDEKMHESIRADLEARRATQT